jgi:SNF2 family DNA or RNA helicase
MVRVTIRPDIPHPLMPHQVETFKFQLAHPVGADFSEVGTGKTIPMGITLQTRWGIGDSVRILWVTTKNMVVETTKEFLRWTTLTPIPLIGSSEEKAQVLAQGPRDRFFYITNYDALPLIQKELQRLDFDSVVCDESSNIKNQAAKRSKALRAIAKNAKFRWIMTGTPLPNTVLDIYGQWKFVEPTLFESTQVFKQEYCIFQVGARFPILIGYKNLDSLQKLLFVRAVRFLRDQCFQLPERTFIRREITLGKSQRAAYKQLKEDFLYHVREDSEPITVKGILDQLIKLSEVTSGFIIDAEQNKIALPDNAKLEELEDVLDECDLRNNKVIIWALFTYSIELLQSRLSTHKPAVLYGKTVDRSAELDRFRQDPSCRVLICQISIGEGFTVNEAPIAIYYEHSFSWKDRDQSLGRNYRKGQDKKVVVFDLVCKATVDVMKLRALQAKKSIQDIITGEAGLIELERIMDGE